LEILRLRRSPLIEPRKGQARWCKVGADSYSVLAYSCGGDRSKWNGSAMQTPTCDDHFLNNRDQLNRIGRDGAIVRKPRSWNCFSPNCLAALVYERHLDVCGTYIEAAAECAHGEYFLAAAERSSDDLKRFEGLQPIHVSLVRNDGGSIFNSACWGQNDRLEAYPTLLS
jgi:hypothetical protein